MSTLRAYMRFLVLFILVVITIGCVFADLFIVPKCFCLGPALQIIVLLFLLWLVATSAWVALHITNRKKL